MHNLHENGLFGRTSHVHIISIGGRSELNSQGHKNWKRRHQDKEPLSAVRILLVLKERHVDEMSHCFILECQRGFYKDSVSNSKCMPCPANSASDTGRTGCTCKEGYYRSSNLADCEGIHVYISVWSCPNR